MNDIRHIKSSERTLHAIECAQKGCEKDSLTATPSGVLTWLSPHGADGRDKHANSTTIWTLIEWWVEIATKQALINLREMIDKKLERTAA
jgi:hypothetical protein